MDRGEWALDYSVRNAKAGMCTDPRRTEAGDAAGILEGQTSLKEDPQSSKVRDGVVEAAEVAGAVVVAAADVGKVDG
jgi:hypothetical protein